MAMSHSVCASQPQGRRIWVIRLLSRTQPDASVFRLIEEHTTAFRPGEEFHAPNGASAFRRTDAAPVVRLPTISDLFSHSASDLCFRNSGTPLIGLARWSPLGFLSVHHGRIASQTITIGKCGKKPAG